MAQIVNRTPDIPWGYDIGQQLGQGLQELAQMKMQQMQQKQAAKAIKAAYPTLSDEQALSVAKAPKEIATPLLAQLQKQQQIEAGRSALMGEMPQQDMLGMLQQLSQPQAAPMIPTELGAATPEQVQAVQALEEQFGPSGIISEEAIESIPQGQAVTGLEISQQPVAIPQQQVVARQVSASLTDSSYVPGREYNRALAAGVDPRTAYQMEQQAKLESKKERLQERKLASEAFKDTKEFRKEVFEKARSAKQNLFDLNRMDELNQSGKLDDAGYVEFLKNSGLDFPALLNPESEEFQKIAQTFMRDIKQYVGARVSNLELEQFMKTIPTLSQSPEGRNRVIANMKRFNRINVLYNNALKDTIKENNGIPPYDLMEQVLDRVDPKIDALTDQFKKDLTRDVPKAKRDRVTQGLMAVAGGIVGAPGKILGKIGGFFGGGKG